MSFTPILISSALEARLRARAAAAGVSVETYLERIAREDQEAEEELEALALEGLHSGDPIDVGSGYWEEKHRRLEERLKKTRTGGDLATTGTPRARYWRLAG